MREIEVRRARGADLDQVVACQSACWEEAYADLVPRTYLDRSGLASTRRERWRRRIDGERTVVVAVDQGEVVGVASAGSRKDADVEAPTELKSLYVRKALWGNGVGTRILAACVEDGDAYLWVFEDNLRARAFYGARDFGPDGAGKLDEDTGLWEIRLVRRTADDDTRMRNAGLVDYESDVDDNARWADFAPRDGDIVISTRSKSGTTWVQMICALLVFQTPALPAPLSELSPWLDHLVVPQDEVFARLASQRHRRIVKTHTPLDGIRLHDNATYIVVVRQPLDMAVSMYHQGDNLDRVRIAQLTGQPVPTDGEERPPVRDWLLSWIGRDEDPRTSLDSLPGVLAHAADARRRSATAGNVMTVRYEELLADLDREMRRVAHRLGIAVDPTRWPDLVRAATIDEMRAHLEAVVPDAAGIFKDRGAFFRRASAGAGAELLTVSEYATYRRRVRELSSAELDGWLHGDL